ncbi:esterase/lipase [Exophiala aquamarina CBS 119918]|uniref:Esterase/lipase n=1 Tax=Exophiala aquamarina CBS 119918 TaxID=1182545 RepID=A0A072P6I9_9EURO|nr:esterase/lipase [Exophiala aquamarina CBS 119918]KEF55481.1 esterase/lipase [Exophiala aquamarina CBS 119918]
MSECCLKGFRWEGEPKGQESKLTGTNCYVTGSTSDVAILVIHDVFGWTFPNIRLLADHYAEEVGATVYIPDFFGGTVLPFDVILDQSRWGELNLPEFLKANNKVSREPEIDECAKALRSQYKRVAAVGFCFGGPVVFRLGAKGRNLVDCISAAHPSFLEEEEIAKVGVPVQIIAPETDPLFTPELKTYSNATIPTLGIPYDYQHFPGLEHGFATRGDPKVDKERDGMLRAKNAAVLWFRQWLHDNN